MLCSICKKNEATVHLTQIVGDQMQKVDMCEPCSREKGVNDPAGGTLAHILMGLGGSAPSVTTADSQATCPSCGYSQAEFKKTGRLGCSRCYEAFGESLRPLLKSMHKGIRHRGKTPAGFRERVDFANRLEGLEERLQEAIDEERFEDAAGIRDEINKLKKQMSELVSG